MSRQEMLDVQREIQRRQDVIRHLTIEMNHIVARIQPHLQFDATSGSLNEDFLPLLRTHQLAILRYFGIAEPNDDPPDQHDTNWLASDVLTRFQLILQRLSQANEPQCTRDFVHAEGSE